MSNDDSLRAVLTTLAGALTRLDALINDPAASVHTRVDLGHARHSIDRATGFAARALDNPYRWITEGEK